MGVHGRWRNVCARNLMALNPPGHRGKRLYVHRFLAGKQGKRFDDACVPPVTRTVVYSWHLFREGIANECRLCAVQRLIAGMCRTPLATAPHASVKNWNRISRPFLYFILSPFTYQSLTWKKGLARKCAHFVVVLLKPVFSLTFPVLRYCTTDFNCDRCPERRPGMSHIYIYMTPFRPSTGSSSFSSSFSLFWKISSETEVPNGSLTSCGDRSMPKVLSEDWTLRQTARLNCFGKLS